MRTDLGGILPDQTGSTQGSGIGLPRRNGQFAIGDRVIVLEGNGYDLMHPKEHYIAGYWGKIVPPQAVPHKHPLWHVLLLGSVHGETYFIEQQETRDFSDWLFYEKELAHVD